MSQRASLQAIMFVALTAVGSPMIGAQASRTSQAQDRFEVASVRPSDSDLFSLAGVQTRPGGAVAAENVSLRRLISFAYGIDDVNRALEGGTWRLLDRNFSVQAKARADAAPVEFPNVGPLNVMMQQLLAERFKLVVRWEDRAQSGYALTRGGKDATLGPRIRSADFDCGELATKPQPVEKTRRCFIRVRANELDTAGRELSEIASFLSTILKRPVVDKTGLTGTYELQLTFDVLGATQLAGVTPNGSPSTLPSLFTAIQEQWGLKLESQRINVQTLIVEHVEPPSEN